jgi:AraC-like DNA-binding protein
MSYTTYKPSPPLDRFVKLIAINGNDDANTYNVLPDTSIVMGFQYAGNLSWSMGDVTIPLSNAGITGLRDRYRTFSHSGHIGTVLVVFSETGAAAFLHHPMHELFNESLSLDDFLLRSQMDVVTDCLCEARTDAARIAVVEQFLLTRLDATVTDELVNLAVMLIREAKGTIRMTALAERLFISQSRLEKRFRKLVGATPKKFAAIVRLQHVLQTPSEGKDLTGLALDAGYFDQAHFIRDFKSFTGQTPERFFRGK